MPDARKYFDLPSPFAMKRGGALTGARLAFETWGTLSPQRDNAIFILTGLSPGAHAASNADDPTPGWWEDMIGPGKPIDSARWFVICANSLGSCKGSTGPASIDPATGKVYKLTFPDLALEDIANASFELVRHLGVERLACLIGNSMGGMSALGYLANHPGSVRAHISISTAPQAQPFAIAIRSLQREAIRLDPNWRNGDYDEEHYPEAGMSIARKLGVITYRSAMEWVGRFARIRLDHDARPADDPFGAEFAVESYLVGHARKFVRSFDPNCYLYLSRASDWFDVGEYAVSQPAASERGTSDQAESKRGPSKHAASDLGSPAGAKHGAASVAAALKRIELERALVIGVSTDILFPLSQQQEIAEGLQAAGVPVDFVPLDSPQGHDAFLVDIARFGAAIAAFLAKL